MRMKFGLTAAGIFAALIIASFSCTATAQALLQVGAEAPGFSLTDIDGKPASLASYGQKKTVVIVFWATWSAHSAKALKRFEEFSRKYGERGVQVVGINVDNQTISEADQEKIKKFVKELGITYPILLDRGLNTFHTYEVMAIPSTTVVSSGKIMYTMPGLPLVGTEDMFEYLQVLAGDPPRKKTAPQYEPLHDAVATAGLARGFVKKNQRDMAYPLYQKAIEKDPKFMLPYVELAKLYEIEGKNAEAEGILKKALSVDPEQAVVMAELGYLQARAGRVREALDLLDKAVKRDSYPPAQYYRAYALGKSGQLKEALGAFDEAAALNPYDAALYQVRAEIYEQNKMVKEAASDYRKALELILKIRS